MRGWWPAWRVQYLAIALLGASTIYLSLFFSLPREIADLLVRDRRAQQEAAAGLLRAYLEARRAVGVPPEAALREVAPALGRYTLYALPPDFPSDRAGVSPVGIALSDGRHLALGWEGNPCPTCQDPAFWFRILGISAMIWLVLVAVHIFLWIRFSTWLGRIRAVAQAIAAGDPHPDFPASPRDELGQILESMREIAASLARFRESRRQFLIAVGHELMTPLSVMIRDLEDALATAPEGEVRQRIRRALDHGWHLQQLIDASIAAAREDRSGFPVRPEPLDLADHLIRIVDAYLSRFEASGRQLRLSLEHSPLPVRADPLRLRQILGNLLENALRYSRPGDTVEVVAGRGAQVSVEVRGGTFTGRSVGMGVGMYLVEELMRAHGGAAEFLEGPEGVLWARLIFPLDPSAAVA